LQLSFSDAIVEKKLLRHSNFYLYLKKPKVYDLKGSSLSFLKTLVKKCGVLATMVSLVSGTTSGTDILLHIKNIIILS
jgi:hypothetical protein